jgi:hypothetical protein
MVEAIDVYENDLVTPGQGKQRKRKLGGCSLATVARLTSCGSKSPSRCSTLSLLVSIETAYEINIIERHFNAIGRPLPAEGMKLPLLLLLTKTNIYHRIAGPTAKS